jgi:phosphoglycerate dehydrogenase-like enzyme
MNQKVTQTIGGCTMATQNLYDDTSRLLAYTMYRTNEMDIGIWGLKRIAELVGHSAASLRMKVSQFDGISRNRDQIGNKNSAGPGLDNFTDEEIQMVRDYKDVDTKHLTKTCKTILRELWAAYKA